MPAMIEELYKMPNVFPKDLAPFIRKGAPVVEKYSNKPLAMLLSPFQEIIFMDSDSLFFQNPELMYHWASYKETGALFFRDRTLEPGQNGPLRFFKALVPNPSERARQSRFWEMTSYHEGESGALVLDKKRGGLFVLLLATMLNLDPYKTIMYEPIRG